MMILNYFSQQPAFCCYIGSIKYLFVHQTFFSRHMQDECECIVHALLQRIDAYIGDLSEFLLTSQTYSSSANPSTYVASCDCTDVHVDAVSLANLSWQFVFMTRPCCYIDSVNMSVRLFVIPCTCTQTPAYTLQLCTAPEGDSEGLRDRESNLTSAAQGFVGKHVEAQWSPSSPGALFL